VHLILTPALRGFSIGEKWKLQEAMCTKSQGDGRSGGYALFPLLTWITSFYFKVIMKNLPGGYAVMVSY
jgi:hypothetical protein